MTKIEFLELKVGDVLQFSNAFYPETTYWVILAKDETKKSATVLPLYDPSGRTYWIRGWVVYDNYGFIADSVLLDPGTI